MSTRAAPWLAWSLSALCVALAAASLILALLNERTLGEIFMAWGLSIVTLATLTVSFSAVGALITSHRPENPIGWIFLAVGFFYGLLSAGEEYAIYALLTNPGYPPGSRGVLADAVDLGAGARPNPGVPAPSVPRWSPAVAPLAPGCQARRALHR